MNEISPGIWHWPAYYDSIGMDVHSYWIEPAGIVLDPMVPPDAGLEWWDDRDVKPQQVVLTIGLHWRESDEFAERFGTPIVVPKPALHRYEGTDRDPETFEWGDEIAPGVTAIEIGGIAPDEAALHIEHGDGAVAIADGAIRASGGGPLTFVPDGLMGDDPETVKSSLRDAFRGLLTRDWDALLMAHGEPIPSGAQKALKDFIDS
jgi:Metallo-beta-lactamase superfamily